MFSAIVDFDFEICTIPHDNVRLPSSMSFVQQLNAAQTFCLSLNCLIILTVEDYSLCSLIQHSTPKQCRISILIAEPKSPW